MNPVLIAAIAQAAIEGVQEAIVAWPLIFGNVVKGTTLTDADILAITRASDVAHDALQLARPPGVSVSDGSWSR